MKEIKRMKYLIEILNKASNEYYNGLHCNMSDTEWDHYFDELTHLENKTTVIYANSPTQNAGYPVMDNLPKIKHSTPLLSLGKTKDVDKLLEFLGDREGVLMHKLDGGTQVIDYDYAGCLNYLATRGSSATNEGQDITHNSKSIIGIPAMLGNFHVQVVGEAIMYKSKLEEINSMLKDVDTYANARNLANASSSMLDSKRVADRDIRFIAFGTLEDGRFKTKIAELEYLASRGFNVVAHSLVSKHNLKSMVEQMTEMRNSLDYDIDGLVLAHNDIAYGKSLGKTSHHFKNAIAYKFGDEEVETILTDILVDIGKSGQVSYVGEFETVELCGSQVSRASLSNYNLINGLQLGIGDAIMVRKANEIIPQITENLTRSGTYKKILSCPVCGSELEHNGVHQFCKNFGCSKQVSGRLVHWASRDAMNIESMSEKTIDAIRTITEGRDIQLPILNKIDDFYGLYRYAGALLKLPKFGENKLKKLINAIEVSKTMPLNRVIYGLSIPNIGRTASKKIAEHYGSMRNIIDNAYPKEIINLVGDSVAIEFINYFQNKNFTNMLESLLAIGLTMTQEIEKIATDTDISGLNICVTGKLNSYSRKEIEAKIVSSGGKVAKSISKTTNILVCNEPSETGKYKKAIDLGTKIITEDQFIEMIGG